MVSYRDFGYDPEHLDTVLSSLAEQTDLKFQRRPEDQDVWFMVDEKGQP